MKRKFFTGALIAAFIIAAFISTAFAQGFGGRGFGLGLRLGADLLKKLTDEQVNKIKSLHYEVQKEIIPLQADMQIKQLEMRRLWEADTLDEAAIIAKAKEISAVQSQLHEKMVRHRVSIANVLTKEQREEFLTARPGQRFPRGAFRGERRLTPRRGDGDDDRPMRRGPGGDDDRPRRGPGGPNEG
jgi:Spy/CpxP family protein refolding chaperone